MATRKAKSTAPPPANAAPERSAPPAEAFFPYARYISIVGVHTSLLAFSALFLPRAAFADLATPAEARARPKRDGLVMLTENPARTLGWMCFGALVLQVWWGSWLRQWVLDGQQSLETKEQPAAGDVKEGDLAEKSERRLKHQERHSGSTKILLHAGIATLAGSFVYHAVVVLFGAPLVDVPLRTYLLSLLLALLTVFPPAYTLGIPSLGADTPSLVHRLTWVRLFAELSPRSPIERALVYPTIGAFLGCWSGVIPIGLDWDRPWQAWPLTPAWGAFGGYIVGALWAMVVSNFKNIVDLGMAANREDERTPKKKSKKKN